MRDDDDMLDATVATVALMARRPARLSTAARARVLLAVHAEALRGRPGSPRHRLGWVVQPRSVRLSPLAGLALAAGLVGIGLVVGLVGRARNLIAPDLLPSATAERMALGGGTPAGTPIVPTGAEAASVKFVLVAPQASEVTVVGDFNNWNPSAHPMARTGGTWTVTVPLEAGRHEYSFVVDGKHWMPDPAAPLAPDDGFGVANSVLLVSRSTS